MLTHGVAAIGPTFAATPAAVMRAVGKAAGLSIGTAAKAVENPDGGRAYLDLRETAPQRAALADLRSR